MIVYSVAEEWFCSSGSIIQRHSDLLFSLFSSASYL